MAFLTSAIFWGALLGTLLWGVVSDVLGRRKAVVVAMAFCGGFGLLSAFSTSFGSLLVLRLLAGVGVGGSVPVVFSYLVRAGARCPSSIVLCLCAWWDERATGANGLWCVRPVPFRPLRRR